MYMFISEKKPISQLGLFEKPRILITITNQLYNWWVHLICIFSLFILHIMHTIFTIWSQFIHTPTMFTLLPDVILKSLNVFDNLDGGNAQ